MARIGYARVSSDDQNLDRQDLGRLERLFEEKASGKNTDRPALKEMLSFIRQGDEVVVWSMDRLARSLIDLTTLVTEVTDKGATIEFLSEKMTFKTGDDDPFAKLQLHMLGAFAEFERSLIKKRQHEGIQKARAKGTYKGSKPWLDYDAVKQLNAEGVSKVQIAKRLGISRQSVYRILG